MHVLSKITLAVLAAAGTSVALMASAGSAMANVAPSAGCKITNATYTVNGGPSLPLPIGAFAPAIPRGSHVVITFSVPTGCTDQLTLAAYRAPSATSGHLPQQILDNYTTGTFTGGGPYTLSATTPGSPPGDASQCSPQHNNSNGGGANQSPGPYDPTCDGSASGNGKSTNNNSSKPCAGCVGNADGKNPPGQYPNGNDPNAGYECDSNQGVGQTNPAHTGCQSYQLDFAYGPVITQLSGASPDTIYGPGLITQGHG
jgi:hypothetical protein